MQMIDPDILRKLCAGDGPTVSPGLCIAGLLIGAMLWFVGGLTHRFWVVLGATVIAGGVGLMYGSNFTDTMPPLVVGLLLAIAVGAVSLSLFRIALFAVCGGLAAFVIWSIWPSKWDAQLVCFVAGGLLGLALHRFCVMALTSFGGTLLMAYSGLALFASSHQVDIASVVEKRGPQLNWAVGSATVLGILVQFLIQRRGKKGSGKSEKKEEESKKKKPEKSSSLWERVLKAG